MRTKIQISKEGVKTEQSLYIGDLEINDGTNYIDIDYYKNLQGGQECVAKNLKFNDRNKYRFSGYIGENSFNKRSRNIFNSA